MQYLRILLVAILAFGVCGCFAAKQPEQPEKSAWGGSEEWRLKSLEENFLNFKEGLRQQNNLIESNHKDTTAQIEKLENRISEMDSTLAELKQNQQKMLAMNAEAEITPEETVVTEEVVMGGTASSEEKPWMVVPGENPVPGQDAANAAPAPVSSLSGDALYQEGVRLVMNDKPLEARGLLEQYLSQNPSSKLAPNALYWVGETYYSEKSFAQSILKFKEVSRRFPKAGKVPAAMLKIGLAYDKLGDRENAVFYLRTLIEDYPKSDPAKIGRERLRAIEG
ncbi:tol-pal system protein YbgF [Desulfovibrio sp. JC010]|uniref:tol-pal system protein YbgF n=1 Tax=Desulfovibrio sp. JC010 TaxID=2593641 RepID=UPI0013D22DF7|nr:tol-pal system protein YbgF [Desulfovibrio sp. JC010]NDV25492.1 tol-pal system protein YbgF [Desulfovibrio sp. JC010]